MEVKYGVFRVYLAFSLKEKLRGYKCVQTGDIPLSVMVESKACSLGYSRWWLQIHGNDFGISGGGSTLLSQVFSNSLRKYVLSFNFFLIDLLSATNVLPENF